MISSVTVGTSTSAVRTASAICSGVIGVSSRLSRASNSSRIRVSIESGSLRVTTTRGFFLTDMSCSHEAAASRLDLKGSAVQTSLTRLFETAAAARSRRCSLVLGSSTFPAGNFGAFWLFKCSVLSSRRPRQDKNPGSKLGDTGEGCRQVRSLWRATRRVRGSRQETVDGVGAFLFRGGARRLHGWAPRSAPGFRPRTARLTTSGLPVPRYVSLKSDHVNVRAGPTKDNDVAWVYTRSGLPVEITAEFENWRRVRDSEGAEGWVYHSLLSGRRTAVVTMKTKDDFAPLYDRADPDERGRGPACRPASSRRSSIAPPAGAVSRATALTAGSSSSGCGVSTPTRRSNDCTSSRALRRIEPGSSNCGMAVGHNQNAVDRKAGQPGHDDQTQRCRNSALLAQPHDHVDAADLVAFRHVRHLLQHEMRIRDVDQLVIVFEIEVVMRADVGVEIGLGAVDADLAQQSCSVSWLSVL